MFPPVDLGFSQMPVFTWPSTSKDAKKWCSSCPNCQKAGKKAGHRVPLCPLPAIFVPFSRLAFNEEAPLMPKAKLGNRYIHTYMCLGAEYLEAIKQKWIVALSFADTMVEIFSHTGILAEIPSDQRIHGKNKHWISAMNLQSNTLNPPFTTLKLMASSKDGMVH